MESSQLRNIGVEGNKDAEQLRDPGISVPEGQRVGAGTPSVGGVITADGKGARARMQRRQLDALCASSPKARVGRFTSLDRVLKFEEIRRATV